ncbi:MAG: hypothetical protein H6828_12520 [Planctomycetes bacterium]|nr:hypothetical protein [Planctomycetota bacterium]
MDAPDPNCLRCRHHYVTYVAPRPHGCRVYGLESRELPAQGGARELGRALPRLRGAPAAAMSGDAWRRRAAELAQCESAGGRRALGGYSIEGLRLVERALRAGVALEWVLAARSLVERARPRERELLDALAAADVLLHLAPDAELARLVAGRSYGALLGFVRAAPELPLAAPRGDELWVAVHDAEDPGNVGALVRTAHAAGAAGLVALGASEPWHPKAVRTSMGSAFRLPLLRRADPAAFLAEARAAGLASVAALARGGAPLEAFARPAAPLVLWLGSEAFGLPAALAASLEHRVSIRQGADVDSYSLNAAAAILCHALAPRG